MDIHAKSVDMDGKFHIHGIPDNHEWCRPILVYGTRLLTNVITVSRNVKKSNLSRTVYTVCRQTQMNVIWSRDSDRV